MANAIVYALFVGPSSPDRDAPICQCFPLEGERSCVGDALGGLEVVENFYAIKGFGP